MTEQCEALRLADALDARVEPQWIHAVSQTPRPDAECIKAAAELRRLVEEIKEVREENAELRAWFEVESGNSVRRLKKIEEQRDLLLRTLKDCEITLRTVAKDDEDFQMARQQVRDIRAAIKAVEQ